MRILWTRGGKEKQQAQGGPEGPDCHEQHGSEKANKRLLQNRH